jgi:exonuclease SbcD
MKFFHTADIHFGVENYGRIDQKTGIHTRLLDFADNLERIVTQAIDEKIDFFLFCGDAYKTAYPTPTQQKLFAQQLLRLHKASIPVVIVVGNHDHPLSFGKAHALDVFSYLPVEGFHVFAKPERKTIQTKSGPIQIVGIPWPTRNHVITHNLHRFKSNNEIAAYIAERVGAIIQELVTQSDPAIPTIMAGHLTVSSGIFSGSEKCAIYGTDPIFLPSQLTFDQCDYVALGHLHRHQNLNPKGKAPIIYAGSLERVDFGERNEQKGFCCVTIDQQNPKARTCSYEFRQLPTRPMLHIEIALEEKADQTQQILDALKAYDLQDAIVKIVYHIPDGKQDNVDLKQIQQACLPAMYVVGIHPIHKPTARERRPVLNIDMDFATLLNRYFETKEHQQTKLATLIEKAFSLKQKVESSRQEQE